MSTIDKEHRPGQAAPEGGDHVAAVATSAVLGGAVAGALAGTVAGPVGTVIGAAAGALAAGVAGNAVAESVDAEAERAYWRDHYATRPYVVAETDFADYDPAYRHGVGGFVAHEGRSFDEVEAQLGREWDSSRGSSKLEWDQARPATRDAWDRLRAPRR